MTTRAELPLPPNRTGGSRASGSPVGGSPSPGLTMIAFPSIKVRQRVQPLLDQERIRPALMVAPTPSPGLPLALAQDTPQPHPHPGVQRSEGAAMTMFEILKPAPQRAIDVLDDHPQTMALGAS